MVSDGFDAVRQVASMTCSLGDGGSSFAHAIVISIHHLNEKKEGEIRTRSSDNSQSMTALGARGHVKVTV